MKTLRAFFTVSFFTLLSRIAGFVRDILMAAIVGVGPVASAFLVAFKLPNFFRKLFAEGAFSAAFIPLYAGKLEAEGGEQARQFANVVFTRLLLVLLLFSGLMIAAMPLVMRVLAPGFADNPALFDLAVNLSRITFVYLLLISLVSLYSGILHAHHRFAVVASAPILLNISFIGIMLFALPFFPNVGYALSWAVVIGGVLQFLWLFWHIWRLDLLPHVSFYTLNDDMRVFFRRLLPGIIGAGVTQINLWIDIIIATFLSSAVAYLYYADRIAQLPLALIGTAMGATLLPRLSQYMKQGKTEEARLSVAKASHLVLLLLFPAVAGVLALGEPIVRLLYERGAFDAQSTLYTAAALMAYSLGLPAYGMIKILLNGYYASGNTSTPVKIAAFCVLVNVVCNLTFVWLLGQLDVMRHIGLALGTVVAAWINMALLLRYTPVPVLLGNKVPYCALLSSVLMGLGLWGVRGLLPTHGVITCLLIVVGVGVYVALMLLFVGKKRLLGSI